MTWKLKRTAQCEKCPWRRDVNPFDIPDGYTIEKHKALAGTIAGPVDEQLRDRGPLRVMACHETADSHCIGWLHNQLGDGNNIRLRLRMSGCSNASRIRLRGDQHATFEDTLPK